MFNVIKERNKDYLHGNFISCQKRCSKEGWQTENFENGFIIDEVDVMEEHEVGKLEDNIAEEVLHDGHVDKEMTEVDENDNQVW